MISFVLGHERHTSAEVDNTDRPRGKSFFRARSHHHQPHQIQAPALIRAAGQRPSGTHRFPAHPSRPSTGPFPHPQIPQGWPWAPQSRPPELDVVNAVPPPIAQAPRSSGIRSSPAGSWPPTAVPGVAA